MSAGVVPKGDLALRRIIDPQELHGAILTPALGDKSRAGATLVDINGRPLARGVDLQGDGERSDAPLSQRLGIGCRRHRAHRWLQLRLRGHGGLGAELARDEGRSTPPASP